MPLFCSKLWMSMSVLLLQRWGKNCSAIKFRLSTQRRDDEAMTLSGYSYNSIEDAMDVAAVVRMLGFLPPFVLGVTMWMKRVLHQKKIHVLAGATYCFNGYL